MGRTLVETTMMTTSRQLLHAALVVVGHLVPLAPLVDHLALLEGLLAPLVDHLQLAEVVFVLMIQAQEMWMVMTALTTHLTQRSVENTMVQALLQLLIAVIHANILIMIGMMTGKMMVIALTRMPLTHMVMDVTTTLCTQVSAVIMIQAPSLLRMNAALAELVYQINYFLN